MTTIVRYLVDNNVLSRLTRAQRSSHFFRENCRLPSEVLHEAAAFPDIANLRQLEIPVVAEVLELVRRVMATVSADDFSLIDLYHNMGNADPILIAVALLEKESSAQTLFPEDWQIVSDDAAVRGKSEEVGVGSIGYAEFLHHLAVASG